MTNEKNGVKLSERLKALLLIQSVDDRFDKIRKEREETPKEIKKLKEDFDFLKKTIEQDLSRLEELKKERRKAEKELEEIELKLQKSKVKLDEVKSNKEYQAVLKEIEDLKELTFQKEEVVIKWMEEIEIQEKECANNDLRGQESQKEYKGKEEEFSQRMKDLDKEFQSLNEEKLKLSQKVDKDLLGKYDSLRMHFKGQVVAAVIDAVCQGCHLGIPPQQYNELIKGDSPQSCPNCNRIIYWEDDREG